MESLCIHPEIDQAATLPASFYTSPEWFHLSKEKIFAKTWQFCASMEALQKPGQLVPHMLLPEI